MKVHWFLGYYKNENSSKNFLSEVLWFTSRILKTLTPRSDQHVPSSYDDSLHNPTNRLIENAQTNQVKVVFLI